MTDSSKQPDPSKQQVYDNVLKRLIEGQSGALIPLFLEGEPIERLRELTVEMLIPPRRGDRVYQGLYKGQMHTIHFEFEVSPGPKIDKRLCIYHLLLLEKYSFPVISILVCPFTPTSTASPLEEIDVDGLMLWFRYRSLALREMDARVYMQKRAVPMYGLLPAMSEVTGDLLIQAFEEMVQYYQEDNEHLRDELLCFRVLLQRAKRLPQVEIDMVLRRIRMFDPLLEEDPWVQEFGDRKAAEGKAEGELKASRDILVRIVRRRFPSLAEIAEVVALQVDRADLLEDLAEQIVDAADEQSARALLEGRPAV